MSATRYGFRRVEHPDWPESVPLVVFGVDEPTTWDEAESIRLRLPNPDEYAVMEYPGAEVSR